MASAGEEVQAEVAEALYRFWFATPSIRGVTWWNPMDGAAWGNEDSVKGALLDDFAREKPVYTALRRLIAREWKTAFRTKTDAVGRVRFRGFAGDYVFSCMNAKGNAMITCCDSNRLVLLVPRKTDRLQPDESV